MDNRDDVVVVGAGAIGLATALALAEAGRRVRLIDAGRVGGGSSHGNCGTITPSHAPPLAAPGIPMRALGWMLAPDAPLYVRPRFDPLLWSWLLRLAARCNPRDWHRSATAKGALLSDSRLRLVRWIQRFDLDCEFAESGVDYIYRDAAAFEHSQRELPLLHELGIAAEAVDGAEVEAGEPALLPGVAGSLRFMGDAVLRPDRYVGGLARAARERGVVIDEHCALLGLQDIPGGWSVETGQGTRTAADVVIATGAWSSQLARMLGLPGLRRVVQPGKGYSITYDAPTLAPRRPLVLRERQVCVTAWSSGYRLGSTMEFSGFDESLNERRLAALERGAAEYLHVPVGPVVRERWFGWRPMSLDDVPLIGPVPARPGLWLATGHGMMGIGMSTGTAQLLADLITGQAPAIDPAPYRPDRFALQRG
jgi:D-amino-acid dehydrogenase